MNEGLANGADDFNVFSALNVQDLSSKIDDDATELNLVKAVASGEAELPSTEKVSASIGQTACATCVGCPFLSQCVKPQALVMKQESERQENV
jgi:hypothetical protein